MNFSDSKATNLQNPIDLYLSVHHLTPAHRLLVSVTRSKCYTNILKKIYKMTLMTCSEKN